MNQAEMTCPIEVERRDETFPEEAIPGGRSFLFCISSLGLGHAARTLPIIRRYLGRNRVFILSSRAALTFLRRELDGEDAVFYEFPDYPPIERGRGLLHFYYLATDIVSIGRMIRQEHRFVEELVRRHEIDLVFSDMRYGCYSNHAPSVVFCHQLEFAMPKATGLFKPLADRFNRRNFENFTKILVPDFADENHNLSGRLSHNALAKKLGAEYVGILSSVSPLAVAEKDIDYLFILSGYLSEHADSFINRLMEQARNLGGKKVFVLGDMSREEVIESGDNTILYSHATGAVRDDLLNRAKVVISRSGYSTLMDLVEIGARGVIIPTPKQTEQEYFAAYHGLRGTFVAFDSQDKFDLSDVLTRADCLSPFRAPEKTEATLDRIDRIFTSLLG